MMFQPTQHLACSITETHDEIRCDQRFADLAAHPIGTEIFSAHVPSAAATTLSASTVAVTSCTRRILAPFMAETTAAAMLAGRRWLTPLPVRCPRTDLRESPTSTG